MKKFNYIAILVMLSVFLFGCNKKDAYSELENSNLSGQDLLNAISSFEKENTEHFTSKVDLADYYFAVGNYDAALEYAIRAESVIKNAPSGNKGKEQKATLFIIRSELEYFRGQYDTALEYIARAKKYDKKNQKLIFLEAQCYFGKNENEKALELFDTGYKAAPDKILPQDETTYSYLLFDAERYEESKTLFESYIKHGEFTSELVQFGSAIYDKTGDFQKEYLCSFADFEYHNCYLNLDKTSYIFDLQKERSSIKTVDELAAKKDVTNLIASYYNKHDVTETNIDFPIAKFIVLANKIESGSFTDEDFTSLLSLETFFNKFPSYYWYAWEALEKMNITEKENYVELLQRIILLGYNNIYIQQAREEIGNMIGLTKKQSTSILLPQEVDSIMKDFISSGDNTKLEKVYALLDLPENDYERLAMEIIKPYVSNVVVYNEFSRKNNFASTRVQERIAYLLK